MAIGQILIYLATDRQTSIDIKLEKDTVWLRQYQMADLFDTERTSIDNTLKISINLSGCYNWQLVQKLQQLKIC